MASKPEPTPSFQALFGLMSSIERRRCRYRLLSGRWFAEWHPDIKRNVLGILDQADEAELEGHLAASSYREALIMIERVKQA